MIERAALPWKATLIPPVQPQLRTPSHRAVVEGETRIYSAQPAKHSILCLDMRTASLSFLSWIRRYIKTKYRRILTSFDHLPTAWVGWVASRQGPVMSFAQ